MLGGAPLAKVLAFISLELAALLDAATMIRLLSCLVVAWLFVVAFRHRRLGLTAA